MNDELNLFIFVVIVFCVICLICQIGHEIYLEIIDSKTTSHIENGIIIDKKEEVNQAPILIGTNIFLNFNSQEYLIVKCNYNTYEIEADSNEYDIGDEVQLQIKEYKDKVISFSII
ncbi:hypothetical protein ACSXC4_10490 [Clostridium perfringens]|uniref:Uncharacterized protein n=1 Tax=Clostridium perfringens TaxID=1502 RepID=A0A127EFR1_CLOPF|nr:MULTISPECIES: hypothetical protein [Clostridium]AMN34774.1 hypothetical protein JFP838_03065 [Clostridium perfringens]MDK7590434.1 hypothetical protein [Clostridium sp. UMB9555B]MDK7628519.1 hypothetical protein [Clostridium sp. UMB9555A]